MTHPDNLLGKSYDDCERRRLATFNACDGIPTEWLERGLIKQMYGALMVIALADKLKHSAGGDITAEQGCVPGDCCYRPEDPVEQERIRKKRVALTLSRPPSHSEAK